MASYPRHGDRFQHVKGWTVYILGTTYRDDIHAVNPEFYCEVKFIYENSGHYSEMPLSWFRGVYTKLNGSHKNHYQGQVRNKKYFPDYSWINDDN